MNNSVEDTLISRNSMLIAMKRLCLLALVTAAIAFPQENYVSNNCPKVPGVTLVPNPSDCHQYYLCVNGEETPKVCPLDKHGVQMCFDGESCDNAEVVPCCNTSKPTTEATPSTTDNPSSSNNCPKGPGVTLVPNPSDCHKYYLCVNGEETPKVCPLDKHGVQMCFDGESCDNAEVVPCCNTSKPTTEATPSTTDNPSSSNNCPKGPGVTLVPNPSDCHKYYLCVNGEETPKVCPLDKHGVQMCFDGESCDNAEVVPCCNTSKPTTEATPSTTDNPSSSNNCPKGPGVTLVPNPSDCHKYYLCVNGEETPKVCPLDKHGVQMCFDGDGCDNAEVVPCCNSSTSTIQASTTSTTEAPTTTTTTQTPTTTSTTEAPSTTSTTQASTTSTTEAPSTTSTTQASTTSTTEAPSTTSTTQASTTSTTEASTTTSTTHASTTTSTTETSTTASTTQASTTSTTETPSTTSTTQASTTSTTEAPSTTSTTQASTTSTTEAPSTTSTTQASTTSTTEAPTTASTKKTLYGCPMGHRFNILTQMWDWLWTVEC